MQAENFTAKFKCLTIKSTGGWDYVIYKVPENTYAKLFRLHFRIDLNSYARAKFSVGATLQVSPNGRFFAESFNRETGRYSPTWGPIEISLDASCPSFFFAKPSFCMPDFSGRVSGDLARFSWLFYEPLGPESFIKITATSPVEEITTTLWVHET